MTETAESLVRNGQADVRPAQVLDLSMAQQEPVKRLMLAVLERAVNDFRTYATVPTGRGRRLFTEVDAWFRSLHAIRGRVNGCLGVAALPVGYRPRRATCGGWPSDHVSGALRSVPTAPIGQLLSRETGANGQEHKAGGHVSTARAPPEIRRLWPRSIDALTREDGLGRISLLDQPASTARIAPSSWRRAKRVLGRMEILGGGGRISVPGAPAAPPRGRMPSGSR
jgi:hypothetical protein